MHAIEITIVISPINIPDIDIPCIVLSNHNLVSLSGLVSFNLAIFLVDFL
jgi:hypothetical protein